MLISKFFNFFKKFISVIIIFFVFDVVFFYFLPEDIKSNLYNNRAHRIKSFYYHHDLRPMSSFYDQWGYERYKIYTNNLGFKDKSNRIVEFKSRNILFIGDSFTEGVGIKYEDTYVGLVEKYLKKDNKDIEVLNAGVQTYSTSIYLSKIYHILERKKLPITDIVVMISGGDIFDDHSKYLDLNDDFILNHIDQKNKYLINIINFYKSNTLTYQLITRITPPKVIPGLIKSFFNKKELENNYTEREKKLFLITDNEIDKMGFLNRKDYAYLYSSKAFNDWGKDAINYSLENLKKIAEISKEKNINLNIFYLYEPVLLLKEPNKKLFNFLIDSLYELKNKKVKVNFIKDMYEEYDNGYDAYRNLFFINDLHWNKKGNMQVAKEIMSKIDF
jgi:lysophospholipase L1-like esterase